MAVEGGMKCVKFLVCVPPPPAVSCPQVCGVALVAIGIYAQVALNQALVVGSSSAASSPVAIMVVGIIIFFVSFFGCCGAWKESYCMVTTVSGGGLVLSLFSPPPHGLMNTLIAVPLLWCQQLHGLGHPRAVPG
uniref:CD63 antigen n=1 Tax=Pavo cristatus TaxID=9049 RepID=A0A8C9FC22_PAVCR